MKGYLLKVGSCEKGGTTERVPNFERTVKA